MWAAVRRSLLTACFLSAGLLSAPAAAEEIRIPESLAEVQLSFAPLAKLVSPAVVNVHTTSAVAQRSPLFDDPILREFFGRDFGPGFGRRNQPATALGSGVIVSSDGLIVTNHHVIRQAESITVALSDLRQFEAEVVLTDESTDLAVLRIDAEESLPHLRLGDSDDLEVGDLVMAVGNPFGVGQTVTLGIVSALARTQVGVSDYSFFIQTDAAINPGNSGGALVTTDGRLIGINTAIYSRTGGSVGIGFAIPANMVRTVIASAREGGEVARPWHGLRGSTVTSELAGKLNLERPGGVVVEALYPNGPAARAGLRPGDVILAVESYAVLDERALLFRLATVGIGRSVELQVVRRGDRLSLTLLLEGPPNMPALAARRLSGQQPLAGAVIGNISPALAQTMGMEEVWDGVVVLEVPRNSTARRFGFRPGDILRALNEERMETADELEAALEKPVARWTLTLERNGRLRRVDVNR
ncbi:MAG: DegQ family serine endoprotease [Pseudomonadota bacterium]